MWHSPGAWVAPIIVAVFGLLAPQAGHTAPLSADMEYRVVNNVGTSWVTVPLANTYTSAVPLCTYVTVSTASRPVQPRIRNITPTSFQLRVQEFTGGSNPTANTTPGTVFCTIADEGTHTLADGTQIQALTATPSGTNGNSIGWSNGRVTNLGSSVASGFSTPVAMVALISANDPQPSAPWVYDCESRGNPPFNSGLSDGICVGKHIGQINGSRVDETIGVILAEQGSGAVQGVTYRFFRGSETINGIGTSTSTGYSVSEDYEVATVTQAGENGGQGGWATLVGSDPLPSGFIRISIDEEVVAGDTSRTHINEPVHVFAYRDDRTISLEGEKSSAIWDPLNQGLFSIPGNDIAYTLTIRNTGDGVTDPDSIFLVDEMPPEVAFYTGDFDPSDADPAAIRFTGGGTNLTFSEGSDAGYATGSTRPASMAECTYSPVGTYDLNVRFVCLNPKGAMASGTPDPEATFEFRGRIE